MKNLLYSLLATGIIVVSANISVAQEVKETKKAELGSIKTEKVRTDVKIETKRKNNTEFQKVKHENVNRTRPIKRKAQVKRLPANIEIKRER